MKLSQLRAILSARDIRLTKSLGQNFLHDANQLRRIAAAAELGDHDRVLEIGPGLGVLTELVAAKAAEVWAIETDERLIKYLAEAFREASNLRLIHADALAWLRQQADDWSHWKVVSNLPYSVASPLLVELASPFTGPKLMVVTLQLEVAKRLFAGPSEKDYGVLTLLVRISYAVKQWFKIPPQCFFPQPSVDSACVVLERQTSEAMDAVIYRRYRQLVKLGFSERRKMMLKLLKRNWPDADLESAFHRLGLRRDVRAESVSSETFLALAKGLPDSTSGNERRDL